MKYTVDRISDGYAVLESDNVRLTVSSAKLPEDVSEGDIIEESPEGYMILKNETEERRKFILNKLGRLIGE